MANIASNKKSVRQTKTRNLRNTIVRSRIRTFRNRVAKAIKSGDLELAKKELSLFDSVADKAGKKNVIHKNKAGRLKGRLAKSLNAAAAAAAPKA